MTVQQVEGPLLPPVLPEEKAVDSRIGDHTGTAGEPLTVFDTPKT